MFKRDRYLPFIMWLVPLSFFAYQFILRLWPGLMMNQIMHQFSIEASEFGMLAAFYYYGYAGMQIPVAIFLERFGARYTIFVFGVLCGVATIIFTFTSNFYLALISRFLIGAGSSVGFLGVSKVVSEYFSREQYPKMISISFTFGLMGAIYGGKPVSVLVETYDAQKVALILSCIAIFIGCSAYAILRNPKSIMAKPLMAKPLMEMELSSDSTSKTVANKSIIATENTQQRLNSSWNFSAIFSSPSIWFIAIANLLMVGALEGFADVWGIPYLMTAYNLPKSQAASLTSSIFYGMLFGGPLLTILSKKIGNYLVIALCGFGMASSFALLFLQNDYNHLLLSGLFYTIGVLCCYQVIIFSVGANLVSPKDLGVTVAFLNCINMLGGSFFHTMIGNIMDLLWTGTANADGVKTYDLVIYKYSLAIIPACATIGSIIICLMAINIRFRYKQTKVKLVRHDIAPDSYAR